MAKIRQSPKLPAEKRRAQLLASAHKLFMKKGYRSTTTEEIARHAGLTKGALYFHFKSKEDILMELMRAITAHNEEVFTAHLKPGMSPGEFLNRLFTVHLGHRRPHYEDMIALWLQAVRIPRVRRHLTGRLDRLVKLFSTYVDPACAGSRKRCRDLAVMMLALVHGLSGIRMISPSLVDPDSQVKQLQTLLDMQMNRKSRSRA
ncbi:MAG TPA: TetR/AcrR family transcriptional regulator [Acidobacteriota bacterium]|nr:TetR/AcrR family transcriptional regulator [Acidobacteriota bacterium]